MLKPRFDGLQALVPEMLKVRFVLNLVNLEREMVQRERTPRRRVELAPRSRVPIRINQSQQLRMRLVQRRVAVPNTQKDNRRLGLGMLRVQLKPEHTLIKRAQELDILRIEHDLRDAPDIRDRSSLQPPLKIMNINAATLKVRVVHQLRVQRDRRLDRPHLELVQRA